MNDILKFMTKNYDVAIIGAGLAGIFCAMQIAQKNKNIKYYGLQNSLHHWISKLKKPNQ